MTGPYDLLVVGFSPVGAALAGLAARAGLRVIVVDRETGLFPLPRAAHLDHEILRIFQELGCADAVRPGLRENIGMDFLSADREVLLSFRSPGISANGWPASVFFHQPLLDAAIRDAAITAGAEVRLGVGVSDLVDDHDGVRVTLDDGTVIDARFAVGCDGARSTVRRLLGTTMDDLAFEEPWLVVDLLTDGPVPGLPELALQVCDPARPHTLVPMPPPRFRFEFMLLPGEDAEAIQRPERVRELVATWVDPDRVEIERAAVYTFHGLIAHEWRAGRVLLAGDAAHQMPPFLGQGMCAGIRDAANLAWKLAEVIRRGAPGALLDTYQAEREPHVRAIVEAAVGFGRLICTTDPEIAAARDAQLRAAPRTPGETPAVSPPLGTGPGFTAGGGTPEPQPIVAGNRLDDLIGSRFAVITAAPVPTDDPDRAWWEPRATFLDAAAHPELAPLLADAPAVVVRPDRYRFGSGSLAELTRGARALLTRPSS
ncbi:MAG: bifunctional 3-(3-hydroxy-phenyl)propionate/3-hydroxycinnamic acid hydroxylase [Actinomycetota bacterium]